MQDLNERRLGSITILSGFCLSFLYVLVFALAYILTSGWVAVKVPQNTGTFGAVWGPPFLISLVAAIPCCSLIFLLKNKLVVPVGFSFLAIYYLIFLLVLHRDYSGVELAYLNQMLRLYLMPPTVVGNFLGWGSYLLLKHRGG